MFRNIWKAWHNRREDRGLFRAVATFVTLVVIMIILGIYGCAVDDDQAKSQAAEQIYQGVPLDKRLLELDKAALEKAYEQHVLLLFSIWLKDDISVVHRINTGLRRGREAYGQAAARIEEREKALSK